MFFSSEHHEHEYNDLKRRQVFVWVFLAFVVLMIGGILAFVVYGVMSVGGGSITSPAPLTVSSPLRTTTSLDADKKDRGDYFLTGELFAKEKKYRIYKVYYPSFSKEEFFALPWFNTAIVPAVAQYKEYLAVFSDPGNGIFIKKDGKVASINDEIFFPPYVDFTISPDGKYMVYFRYLSSVGTTSLTVRDTEKNTDLFGWPVGSSASNTCDFRGWSADGTKAYCTSVARGTAIVKAIDVHRYVVSTIASVSGIRAADYHPEFNALVTAGKTGITLLNMETKETTLISDSPEAKVAENVDLATDGKTVIFTAHDMVYVINGDTKEQKKIYEGTLVAVTPDARYVLFKGKGDGEIMGEYYSMTTITGENHKNLFSMMSNVTISQFLGWFSK